VKTCTNCDGIMYLEEVSTGYIWSCFICESDEPYLDDEIDRILV
jgi:hypothetical protein